MKPTDDEILDLIEGILNDVIDSWMEESGKVWDQFLADVQATAEHFLSFSSLLAPLKALTDLILGMLTAGDELIQNLASVPLRVSIEVVASLMPVPEELNTTVKTTEDCARTVLEMVADAAVSLIANPLPIELRLIERIKSWVGTRELWRNPTAGTILSVAKGKIIGIYVRIISWSLRFGATIFSLFLLAEITVAINRSDAGLMKGVLRQTKPRETITCKGVRINRRKD